MYGTRIMRPTTSTMKIVMPRMVLSNIPVKAVTETITALIRVPRILFLVFIIALQGC